jgi:anti-sigma factor RsiW
MTNCSQVLEHLSEYLDEELPPGACEAIAKHLATCSDCEDTKRRLLESIEVCRQFRIAESPSDLPDEVRSELRAAYLKVRAAMEKQR